MKPSVGSSAALLVLGLIILRCSTERLVGATDMPNESTSVTASVRYPDGSVAMGTEITVVPANYLEPIPGATSKMLKTNWS